jgi:hypothetical protein
MQTGSGIYVRVVQEDLGKLFQGWGSQISVQKDAGLIQTGLVWTGCTTEMWQKR